MNLFQPITSSFTELNTQLTDFGLHPQDWVLKAESNKTVKIQHKEEKTFYFMGQVEKQKGKSYWKTIHLAGL